MTTTFSKPVNGGTVPVKAPQAELYWEPFTAMTGMRRFMDTFFDSMLLPQAFGTLEFQPRTNVYERDGIYYIECALPGYTKDQISVEAKANEVTVTGKYAHEKADEHKQYRRREMQQGSFTRTIAFPEEINHDKVVATLENGVLRVTVYPITPVAPKKIPVSAA